MNAPITPNLRPQRMVGETVIDAVLALEIAAESLREQAAETLVVRDAWDREREARSQRYFARKDLA
jgi:hypothetical protein